MFGNSKCCHVCPHKIDTGSIVLVGSPNVGKSVLFGRLTGSYAVVSNYPGTTVEVSQGRFDRFQVVDTPGMYSLSPLTEEEAVTQRILLETRPSLVIYVATPRNLRRSLSSLFQLLEAGLPVILAINMMDEAEELGISIDTERLSQELGIPVVPVVSTTGEGIDNLKKAILNYNWKPAEFRLNYPEKIEKSIKKVESLLNGDYTVSKRSIALLVLQGDKNTLAREDIANCASYAYEIALVRNRKANEIVARTTSHSPTPKTRRLGARLEDLTLNPKTGIPILILILYFGLYRFVGVFGAGTLVDFLENQVFGAHLNPWLTQVFQSTVPWPVVQDLFVGEYGIFTQALTYAVALILPIVGTFFVFFSILEDTGYLPRLAMLLDSVLKKVGLSGRATIPLVLGFGCGTMAALVTRTLETKRERVISNLLISLSIPCSAQLGVIMALLSPNPRAMLVWAGVILTAFLLVGSITSRLLPGSKASFFMELPPLRLPRLDNIAAKTLARMKWYFLEVLPLFVLASILIWIGRLTGLFQLLIRIFEYPVTWIGLGRETAIVFLFGFFRRDYGAAGLYQLQQEGVLTGVQLVIAAVTLTLFIPCIAQFMVTVKERGTKTALAFLFFIIPMAFTTGFLLNKALTSLGVTF